MTSELSLDSCACQQADDSSAAVGSPLSVPSVPQRRRLPPCPSSPALRPASALRRLGLGRGRDRQPGSGRALGGRMARQAGLAHAPHARATGRAGKIPALPIRLPSAAISPTTPGTRTASIKPELLVAVGICTHLGCSPAGVAKDSGNPSVPAGFVARWLPLPCHGSTFDLAGRVFANKPAPTNLEIPPHFYLDDSRLLIGEDKPAQL